MFRIEVEKKKPKSVTKMYIFGFSGCFFRRGVRGGMGVR